MPSRYRIIALLFQFAFYYHCLCRCTWLNVCN